MASQKTVADKTLSGLSNLIKVLPTGTVFLFQFLDPVVTNNGQCSAMINKYLTVGLVAVCGFSCYFSSFTDSYTGTDKKTHYGIATPTGLWPTTASKTIDLSVYKLRPADFVHAFFSLLVFAVVVLLDANTMHCFYPNFAANQKVLIQVLPPIIGTISGAVFVIFPNTRHGIGYQSSSSS